MSFAIQFSQHIHEAIDTFQSLHALAPRLQAASQIVSNCLLSGGKLLCCGNGGSASDSTHFATEFVSRFITDRRPFPAIAMSDNGGLLTAIGNDYDFSEVFARQVNAFAGPQDVLVCFTTSGRSANVRNALTAANGKQIKSILFAGRDGGYSLGIATVDLLVSGTSSARIQEAHKLLLHSLCAAVEGDLHGTS